MATHSSVLSWRIPVTAEPGGLPSMGSHSQTRLKRLSSSSSKRKGKGKNRNYFYPLFPLPSEEGNIIYTSEERNLSVALFSWHEPVGEKKTWDPSSVEPLAIEWRLRAEFSTGMDWDGGEQRRTGREREGSICWWKAGSWAGRYGQKRVN